jgi:DNA-binding transcriptional ArsR family regulator
VGSGENVESRVDRVFFALADATRRSLMDRLYVRDGQRLSDLAADYEISRQAISKHLEVLASARLVVTRDANRGTQYFLNPAPMREMQAQWVEKFTRLQVRVDCA